MIKLRQQILIFFLYFRENISRLPPTREAYKYMDNPKPFYNDCGQTDEELQLRYQLRSIIA